MDKNSLTYGITITSDHPTEQFRRKKCICCPAPDCLGLTVEEINCSRSSFTRSSLLEVLEAGPLKSAGKN